MKIEYLEMNIIIGLKILKFLFSSQQSILIVLSLEYTNTENKYCRK